MTHIHILTGAELMNIYETFSLTTHSGMSKDVLESFMLLEVDTDTLGS